MFCSKCGQEINSNSDFCNHCGAKINNDISVTVSKERQKEIEIHMLESAKNYLNTIDPLYEKIYDKEERKKALQQDISNGCYTNIKVGVIASIVAIITLFFAIRFLSIPKSSNLLFGDLFSSINIFWGIVWIVACVIAGIVLTVSFSTIPKRKRNIEKMKMDVVVINNQINDTENEIREVLGNKDVIYNESVYYMFFPNGDASIFDIDSILNLMKTCRADSFKEALNLYDEQCHRERMEHLAARQMTYASQAAVAAKAAASAANRAADASAYIAYHK